jgi:hypothetical protein
MMVKSDFLTDAIHTLISFQNGLHREKLLVNQMVWFLLAWLTRRQYVPLKYQ